MAALARTCRTDSRLPSRTWNYAGSLTGPIFTAGAIGDQVAHKAAVYNYQQSIQIAFADVENVLIARQKLNEQCAAHERLVAALRDYSRLARQIYDGGYVPYLTVLQTDQGLFPAELDWATTRASAYTALSASTSPWVAAGSTPPSG
jgi:outer membrane protein, multidrug efflux system